MTTILNFKDVVDLPKWRILATGHRNLDGFSNNGPFFVSDFRNNEDRHPFIYNLTGPTIFSSYNVKTDAWIALNSPGLLNAMNSGATGVFMPAQGPRGVLAAGSTATDVVISTVLPATVGTNQLANRGDGRGFKIRIIGSAAGSSGKTEERIIIGNTSGTTPTITLDSALSFVPIIGDAYEFLSGRVFLLNAGAPVAGQFKYYDTATNSFSGNLSVVNLPTINNDSAIIGLDELYVPFDLSPGQGFYSNLTSTATAATTITGQAVGGDTGVSINEHRNFQIRIVQDTVTPTAVGQRRNITSHTAGPSPVYTVPAWTVTPSAGALFVIENNGDRILLWTSTNINTFTYQIATNAWDSSVTFSARPAVIGATGVWAAHCFSIEPDIDKNARHSFIFSGRGSGFIIDLFDISGAATGVWTGSITYGNSSTPLLGVGFAAVHEPSTNQGRYIYFNDCIANFSQSPFGFQYTYRFDIKNRSFEPFVFLKTATIGANFQQNQRMAYTVFVDGNTKLSFIIVAIQGLGPAQIYGLPITR
jgi:hypothetical protein